MSAPGMPSLARRAAWSAKLALRAPLEARFPFRSPEAIERAQRRRLAATVAHAHAHVPYYRETMRRLGIGPGEIRTAADLAKLPMIEREQLQRDPEYFVSDAAPLDSYLKLRSGGSMGEPIVVFWDRRTLVEGGAHRERSRALLIRLAGRRFRMRQARIVSPLDSTGATSRAFAVTSLLPSALRYSSLELSMLDPPEVNLSRLNDYRPDVIAGYGSYLESLFAHLARTGEPFHRPKAVIYGADPLSEPMRRLIGERFGIEVLSVYGAIEAFHIGFECERHAGLHLNVDLNPVRVVGPDGADAPPGESGEVVVSNLVSRGTVLLNYRLGDVAARLPERCACGRNLPLLSYLEARSDEWIETATGERLHPQNVRAPLSSQRGVWRYQVVQLAPGQIRAEVVAAPDADRDAIRARVEAELARRLGEGAEVELAFVETLPTTARGKVRPVMSVAARRALQEAVTQSR